jgi:hypothetical protein
MIIQNSGVTIDDNDLLTATKLIAGDPGTEGTGINIGGVTYESTFKVSDINGTNFAQTILHRHSTTLEPLIVGARNNSDTHYTYSNYRWSKCILYLWGRCMQALTINYLAQ